MNEDKSKSEMAVTQSNILIESRYKLTLNEIRLFLFMLKEVQPGDKDFKDYRIYIKDFIDSTDSKNTDFYSQAKAITKRFLSKVLELDNGNLQIHFMSMVQYYPGKGYIDFHFDPKLKPYLIRLKTQFTTYDIMNVINCKYSHSIRIYQLLKSFEGQKIKKSIILLKDLRFMLMLENEYTQWHDLKRFVLERARKDLKKHSDIYFEYRIRKKGRSVYAITFEIHKQAQRRLFDNKKDPVAQVSYHGSMTPTLDRLEEEGKDACPMPAELKNRIK